MYFTFKIVRMSFSFIFLNCDFPYFFSSTDIEFCKNVALVLEVLIFKR